LLHSRLSIIDLGARANQPLRFGDKLMVVNGELYNYLELRRRLEGRGSAPFVTTSDSEVLLRILAEDGWQVSPKARACGASRCSMSATAA